MQSGLDSETRKAGLLLTGVCWSSELYVVVRKLFGISDVLNGICWSLLHTAEQPRIFFLTIALCDKVAGWWLSWFRGSQQAVRNLI